MLTQHRERGAEDWQERRRFFYAMCTVMDAQVGRIVDELEQRGELEDTLILFMSDHGDMDGDHGMVSKQASFFDEVMHLPVIFHWPAGLPAGRRVGHVTEATDLLPTLCDLAGVRIPWQVQGVSLADSLRGETDEPPRESALAMHGSPGSPLYAMLRTADSKYIRYGPGREVLYDLEDDPHEFTNRAGDGDYSDRVAEMRERTLQRMLHAAGGGVARHRPF
jgi:arylsulfatase A-like enzyme